MDDVRMDSNGWVTSIVCGRWVQAKIYDKPSKFGVNGGRVSKLSIGKGKSLNPEKLFFEQMDYNYDRGLDFDRLPDGLLDRVLSELEGLPQSHEFVRLKDG